LTEFVDKLRAKIDEEIPYFDPWDGGTEAEVLFLFETPGRQAKNSGFVSRNNPDQSANNFFEFNRKAHIPRKRTISWNLVPWYIGSDLKIRSAKQADCEAGIQYLDSLLELLPKLRAVVFFGKTAQCGVIPIANSRRYQLFVSPHPSPRCVNRAPGNRKKIISVLREVAKYLGVN
jgi:uracil-DNA glycosylase